MHPFPGLLISLSLLLGSTAIANSPADSSSSGVLDNPLPDTVTTENEGTPQPAIILSLRNPETTNKDMRTDFAVELKQLANLPQSELKARAEQGERAAQVVLAENYAREAASLSFAPEAATQAMGDAIRWMSRAAESGFPGAPSLDQVGVKVFPVRAPRSL